MVNILMTRLVHQSHLVIVMTTVQTVLITSTSIVFLVMIQMLMVVAGQWMLIPVLLMEVR